jgi:hypothetical protein
VCHNLKPGQRDKDSPSSEKEGQRPWERAKLGLATLYVKSGNKITKGHQKPTKQCRSIPGRKERERENLSG